VHACEVCSCLSLLVVVGSVAAADGSCFTFLTCAAMLFASCERCWDGSPLCWSLLPVLLYDDIMPVLDAATCGAAVALNGGLNFVG